MHTLIIRTVLLALLLGFGQALAKEPVMPEPYTSQAFQLAQADSSFGGLNHLPLTPESEPGVVADPDDNDPNDSEPQRSWSQVFWYSLTGVILLAAGAMLFNKYSRKQIGELPLD
ncbi:MAG: hypothetical protein U1D69_13365 [Polynucleobacter sp.]|nr:hypothetical protein [Polynucleobacter sp.]